MEINTSVQMINICVEIKVYLCGIKINICVEIKVNICVEIQLILVRN